MPSFNTLTRPRWRRGSSEPSEPGWRAFTLIELLVSMVLLALLSALVFAVSWSTARADAGQHSAFVRQSQVLSFVETASSLLQQVTIPFWVAPGDVVDSTSGSWTVHYWQGDAKKTLTCRVRDGSVEFVAGDQTWRFSELPDASVAGWTVHDRVIGLVFGWTSGGRPVSLHLPWGALPL